jgi:dihydrofolate synthase/folylpolyglutamate synthase
MRQLGHTLAAIAGELAGIIKPGVPVVMGNMEPEPRAVIERVAAENSAPLYTAGVDFQFQFQPDAVVHPRDGLPRGHLNYQGRIAATPTEHAGLELGLIGQHQAANAALAIATVERLREQGWNIPPEAIRAGLANVRCPARVEVLRTEPTVVIDTAHNVASIAALLEVLAQARPFARRTLVFACSKDKDAAGMLRRLWPCFDAILLTRFVNNPRALPPEELAAIAAEIARDTGLDNGLTLADDPAAAWQAIQHVAQRDELICITGSFFLAAELRAIINASRIP